ncbi:unnamed protein product, partial [Mesorhabditis belari]|uniref:Guanylate-binding protein N-terminal domain-containing protein n=1 Tax=Mesorhabditis belari TaxID=2138241 RepID=A0AAF3F958_9BILA
MVDDEVIRRGVDEENSLIPLVTFDENRLNFHETVARETFANEKYRGVKITFVSVMGPSRSGKSFLMSVLTNGVDGNKIHGAFQSGLQRFTEGIHIFTRPIFINETHAVFFLDTQGTFDMQTDRTISAWIAGFSLLFSDIQVRIRPLIIL